MTERRLAGRTATAGAVPVAGIVAGIVAAVLALAGGVVAVAGPAGAAAPERSAFPPLRPTRVLAVGDSVMAGAAAQIPAALPGRDVTVDAAVNRTTNQGAQVVAQRGSDWDVVVVLLAHNDGGSPGVYQPAAERLLDLLQPVPRVVWLTIHEVRPYYRDVNAFLRSEAARRPNLRVADWNAAISAAPGGVAGDGLHLNGRGAQLMAGLVAQAVADTEAEQARFLASLAQATTTAAPTTTTTAPTPTSSTTTTATTTTAPASTIASTSVASTSVAPTVPPTSGPVTSTGSDPTPESLRQRGLVWIVVGLACLGLAAWRIVVLARRARRRDDGPDPEAGDGPEAADDSPADPAGG